MALPGMADDRFQTMSLQSAGACTIANKARPACAHESNYVGDIDGAAPALKYSATRRGGRTSTSPRPSTRAAR